MKRIVICAEKIKMLLFETIATSPVNFVALRTILATSTTVLIQSNGNYQSSSTISGVTMVTCLSKLLRNVMDPSGWSHVIWNDTPLLVSAGYNSSIAFNSPCNQWKNWRKLYPMPTARWPEKCTLTMQSSSWCEKRSLSIRFFWRYHSAAVYRSTEPCSIL